MNSLDRPLPRIGVSVAEAATITGLGESTLREHIRTGALPVCKVGTRLVIRLETLDRWLAGLESPGPQTVYEITPRDLRIRGS